MLRPETVRRMWQLIHNPDDKHNTLLQFQVQRGSKSRKVRLWGTFGSRATVVKQIGPRCKVIVSKAKLQQWLVDNHFDDIPMDILTVRDEAKQWLENLEVKSA